MRFAEPPRHARLVRPPLVLVAPQQPDQSRQLAIGQVLAATLSPDVTATYDIALTAGQFCRPVVDQGFNDLAITLVRPDGTEVTQFDGSLYGTETMSVLTDATGVHPLTIRTVTKSAGPEAYEVTLRELRAPVDDYRQRIGAERRGIEAKRLAGRRTAGFTRSVMYTGAAPSSSASGGWMIRPMAELIKRFCHGMLRRRRLRPAAERGTSRDANGKEMVIPVLLGRIRDPGEWN
jgi:hypothetical protein